MATAAAAATAVNHPTPGLHPGPVAGFAGATGLAGTSSRPPLAALLTDSL